MNPKENKAIVRGYLNDLVNDRNMGAFDRYFSDDVVFTSTYDGTVYALAASDGRTLWRYRMGAGINACPAVIGDTLLVGAGVPRRGAARELVAFR